MTGKGVPKDAAKAVEWFQKAAQKNFVPAIRELGKAYLDGTGIKADAKEGMKLLEKAANKKDGLALCYLGEYLSRPTVTLDGFAWFQRANDQGSDEYYEFKDVLLERKPKKEYLESVYQDGVDYIRSNSGNISAKKTEENIRKATWCFRFGAYYGHPRSQYRYALRFTVGGHGIQRDLKSALILLNAAEELCREDAETGDEDSQSLLGIIYVQKAALLELAGRKRTEEYTEMIDEARRWLEAAASKDVPEALYQLGYLNANNIGATGKIVEGHQMMKRAAELGSSRSDSISFCKGM